MRVQWTVPVIVSILILGTLGLTPNAFSQIPEADLDFTVTFVFDPSTNIITFTGQAVNNGPATVGPPSFNPTVLNFPSASLTPFPFNGFFPLVPQSCDVVGEPGITCSIDQDPTPLVFQTGFILPGFDTFTSGESFTVTATALVTDTSQAFQLFVCIWNPSGVTVDPDVNSGADCSPITVDIPSILREISDIQVTSFAIDFGDQEISTTSSPSILIISSSGTGNLEIASIQISGTHSSQFSIVSGTCFAPLTLPSGDSCNLNLTFTPDSIGMKTASLDIVSNDDETGILQVSLTGNGIDVCVEGSTQTCGSNVGVCQPGIQTCVNGEFGSCEGGVGPEDEFCDGQDNDCDGQTDEGCDCIDGQTISCGTNVGACQEGTQTCVNGQFGACEGDVGPVAEVCDGLDNDCDGQPDNGITCDVTCTDPGILSSNSAVCDGTPSGLTCDAFRCDSGFEPSGPAPTCQGDGTWDGIPTCDPLFCAACGEGTILNENNECVPDPNKVTICHKGKNTIIISVNAVNAHLAHGDTIGVCEP